MSKYKWALKITFFLSQSPWRSTLINLEKKYNVFIIIERQEERLKNNNRDLSLVSLSIYVLWNIGFIIANCLSKAKRTASNGFQSHPWRLKKTIYKLRPWAEKDREFVSQVQKSTV